MAIPDFQSLMLPLLQLASDGIDHAIGDARESLAVQCHLTADERAELLPSGRQPLFNNRVAWAKSFLQQAGLLAGPRRGHFQITERGQEVLREKPPRITIKYLERFPEFVEFRSSSKEPKPPIVWQYDKTPEEMLDFSHQRIRGDLAEELLGRVKGGSPQSFEQLVVDLLVAMGYGGSRKEAGKAIGHSGDEGIDGIINEDRLGLDTIYLQAKKWKGAVGRPEIQKFIGALQGKRAKKGVFITTGTFSGEALDYASQIDPKVVLIDGRQLTQLMMDFNLGVTPVESYEVKRIDSDFFGED